MYAPSCAYHQHIRDRQESRGQIGSRMQFAQILTDLQHALSKLEGPDTVGIPAVATLRLHTRRHREPPHAAALDGGRQPVKVLRGDQESRVGQSHRLRVEIGYEVPVEGAVDQPLNRDVEEDVDRAYVFR